MPELFAKTLYNKPEEGGGVPPQSYPLPNEERLTLDLPRFCFDLASPSNAPRLRRGTWKFDFDEMDVEAIRDHDKRDIRPRWTAETFPGFANFRVLELGPQDGFNTIGLEKFGTGPIVSIEANVDSFLRCLIVKNLCGLRATYLLGDFVAYLNQPDTSADLIYASGVLYHLQDPVAFLLRCGEIASNIFLWTFLYEDETIRAHPYESKCFVEHTQVKARGETFSYHKRIYPPDTRFRPDYAGGIESFANWMTLPDIKRALTLAGYTIRRTVDDSYSGIPAMNIWASSDGDAPQPENGPRTTKAAL